MLGLGFGELLLVAIVVFLIFGASKLPALGQGLGEGVKSFRKAFREVKGDGQDGQPPSPPPPPAGK